jgi:SAM-dependent methyltransferase
MSEVTPASFDRLPYRHGSIPETHPARIGAIARLLGLEAAEPDRCRVLELGCAEGMNLLPLAERFPGSNFTGIDFSPAHFTVAEQARSAAGITNAHFVCADLLDYAPESSVFDYVIAHGVYSWVAPEVRDRVLALCARALAPGGIAYVSYNVYPAWGLLGGLRATLRATLARAADPVAEITRLLPTLDRAFAAQPGPYAALVRELLADMATRPPELLFHDDLEVVCEPVTFLEFTTHAQRHGLHYLAEAHFASMPADHLPAPARDALADLSPDFLHAQQFLDLLGNRRFRNSLLISVPPRPERVPDPAVISQLAVGLHLQPADGRIDLSPGVPLVLTGRHDFRLSISAPAQKAFFAALCEIAPARVLFADALKRAGILLREMGLPPDQDPAPLAAGLARLFTIDQCDLMLPGAGEWLHLTPAPAPSPLMQHQARAGFAVTNRWHEVVNLSPVDRGWVAGHASTNREPYLIRTGLAF